MRNYLFVIGGGVLGSAVVYVLDVHHGGFWYFAIPAVGAAIGSLFHKYPKKTSA